jgi:hypothetical protein
MTRRMGQETITTEPCDTNTSETPPDTDIRMTTIVEIASELAIPGKDRKRSLTLTNVHSRISGTREMVLDLVQLEGGIAKPALRIC